MMITLKEYCLRNNRNLQGSRVKATKGGFKTAKKIGRDWFIDENEPYIDERVTSGNWIGYARKRNYVKKSNKKS